MHQRNSKCAISVDASEVLGSLRPIWRSFGYDELNWTYTPRGKRCFQKIGELSAQGTYYIRTHHAFTSGSGLSTPTRGSGNVYSESSEGGPAYNYLFLDQVCETFLKNNCKPIIELGFMPDALSRGPGPGITYSYDCNNLWLYPPKNYNKWEELVFQTVSHYVQKYGEDEVSKWYWELWNEPDSPIFFKGNIKDYCKLYDYSVSGAVRALPDVKIGGPGVGGNIRFLEKFLKHCSHGKNFTTGERGTRLNFISFHAKGTEWPIPGQKEERPFLEGIINQLSRYDRILKRYSEYSSIELLFDECDMAVATNFGLYDYPFYKFNNTHYYPVFVIRTAKAILDYMMLHDLNLTLFTTWAFYLEGKRFFEGNRALFTNEDIKKPVFNAFAMLERLGNLRVRLDSNSEQTSLLANHSSRAIDGLATLTDDRSAEVLIWYFNEDQEAKGEAEIELHIKNLPFTPDPAKVKQFRIDIQHSNSYSLWLDSGAPQDPSKEQIQQIQKRDSLELIDAPEIDLSGSGDLRCSICLPVHSASLIRFGAV